MRILIVDCSAKYSGRGDTTLPRGIRSVIIKKDGSVSIHNDVGNKPLNYMKKATLTVTSNELDEAVWTFDTRHESLQITIHNFISSNEYNLMENDPGLQRDGTEDHLQKWLSENPEFFGEGYTLVSREYPTGNGPVDLLVVDPEGHPVAVEVKRTAMLGAVDQCRRYIDALSSKHYDYDNNLNFSNIRAILVALDIRPRTQEYADKHHIQTFIVPSDYKTHIFENSHEKNFPQQSDRTLFQQF